MHKRKYILKDKQQKIRKQKGEVCMTPDTTRNPAIYFRNQLPVLSWFLLYHVLGGSINPFFLTFRSFLMRLCLSVLHLQPYTQLPCQMAVFTTKLANYGWILLKTAKKKTDELQVLENVTVSFAWTSLYQSFCY